MAKLNPYLIFNGNCEKAFKFYRSVFGGEFQMIARYKEMPPDEVNKLPENAKEKLMHISLPIGKETILMGSDANPLIDEVKIGQNISLSIIAESKEEADNIFKRLSEGGKITMPIADTFWNAYYGMLTDIFQINWMINFDYPKKDVQ